MATCVKFYQFVEDLHKGIHDFNSHTFKLAITNTAPNLTDTQLSNITEISYTNLSARTITITSVSQSSGTLKVIANDLTMTSTGGTTGAGRYLVLYNDTSTNDKLVCYWDKGTSFTLQDGDQLVWDADGTNGFLQAT